MKVSRDFNVYDAFTLLENVPPTEKVRRTPLIGNLRRDTVYYFDLSESNKPIFVDDYAYGQKESKLAMSYCAENTEETNLQLFIQDGTGV